MCNASPRILRQHIHVSNVKFITFQESCKFLGVVKFLDLGLVGALSELAPRRVEHHLSKSTQTGVFLDISGVAGLVFCEMLTLYGRIITDMGWPIAGFSFNFQPGVENDTEVASP